jgi:hypothetical protein
MNAVSITACYTPVVMSPPPHIEVRYFAGCPHAESARGLVRRCLENLGLEAPIEERDGDYPSPTILVDGVDVTGSPASLGRACRVDLPTEAQVTAALLRALHR